MSTQAFSYEEQLKQAKAFMLEKDHFLVVSHVNPDGDAIGSTLAVAQMLQQLGKSFVLMNEGAVPKKFDLLPGPETIMNYSKLVGEALLPGFSHVISVDCADYSRIGNVRDSFPPGIPILNIDHHPTNDFFGSCNLIKADAAATAEILYDLAVVLGLQWTEQLARCIYTGLLTDTGGFRYSNTTPKVMLIASDMLQAGVNGYILAEELLEKLTFPQIAILRKALSTLSFAADKKIAWLWVSTADLLETGAGNEDMDGLVNYPRNIEGVEVGLLFKQAEERKYKVSLRSAGRVDVARIAQSFGGGGHVRAAGCTMTGTLEEAADRLIQEVERALQ